MTSVFAFGFGTAIVVITVLSAVRTVVLPHGRSARLTRWVFVAVRRALAAGERAPLGARRPHELRSLGAPLALVCLPMLWLTSALVGFTAIFWALDTRPLSAAFKAAGSAMLTIGFFSVDDIPRLAATFFAAALTISVLALLLVTYLPTMYQAYSDREVAISALETYAGAPPDPVELIDRYNVIGAFDQLTELWRRWQHVFFELRESHTALPAVVLFASSSPDRHWLQAVEAVLDGAALANAIAPSDDPQASLCLRAGRLALTDMAEFYGLPFNADPKPGDPIAPTRDDFDLLYERLAKAGCSPSVDPDEAWQRWSGWRVNYDLAIAGLADLTRTTLRHQR